MTKRIQLSFDTVELSLAEQLASNEKEVGVFAFCSIGVDKQTVANQFDCSLVTVDEIIDRYTKAGVRLVA